MPHPRSLHFLLVARCSLVVAAFAPLQIHAQQHSHDLYADEPYVFEQYRVAYTMRADGSGESLSHMVIKLQSEGAAKTFSVLAVGYASHNSDGSLENVEVRKPDGTIVKTPSTDAMELPAPVTREAPLYSDLKERQLPVRSLSVGDTLSFDRRITFKSAEAPGQFWGAERLVANGAVVLQESLDLTVPASKFVDVWSPNHKPAVSETGGNKTYHWESSQLKPTSAKTADGKPDIPKDPDTDAEGVALPSVAWTTFRTWQEVGDWYRGLADERMQPTDALKARADALTHDAKTPEEQVRAIYLFVSEQTRYVGIDLGIGRYQPHPAQETLSNQYGDCKDKDTLLEALLRAKGFKTAPALIGSGIATVKDLPSPAMFNHAITTVDLPSADGKTSRIWLDSTPGVSPYRVLQATLRDRWALVVPPHAPAELVKTPAEPPFAYLERFVADAALAADGTLTSKMTFDVRSDNEPQLRYVVRSLAPSQWDQGMQNMSGYMGFGGTVSATDFRQTDNNAPVHLTWQYKRPEFGDWANHRILPLFPALEIATIDKDKAPEYDIDQGAPRTLEALTTIQLPDKYRAELPDPIHVHKPYATFDQTYKFADGKLTMERRVVILRQKVAKSEWKDYLAYTKAIGMESGENYIPLLLPNKPVTSAKTSASGAAASSKDTQAASSTAVGNAPDGRMVMNDRSAMDGIPPEAADLMKSAAMQIKDGDIQGAKKTLGEAKAKYPGTPYLLTLTASIALMEKRFDDAEHDLKTELATHPDGNPATTLMLAGVYAQQKRHREAAETAHKVEANGGINAYLLEIESFHKAGDDEAALQAARRGTQVYPQDVQLQNQLVARLRDLRRNEEAAAIVRASLDGAEDPMILNSGSYELAEMRQDLPLAEEKARKAVSLLEAKTEEVVLSSANSSSFASTSLLIASYDTLADILLLQGRPEAAEPYQTAAWFGQPDITTGLHLAQIQESLGRKADALHTYDLALGTEGATNREEDYKKATEARNRIKTSLTETPVAASSARDPLKTANSLQEMRTFRLKRTLDAKSWGTFRVQIGPEGIVDAIQVSGSPDVKSMTAVVKSLRIPGAVPLGSKAKLLRDGVLSCSSERPECEFVLMTRSGLQQEGVE